MGRIRLSGEALQVNENNRHQSPKAKKRTVSMKKMEDSNLAGTKGVYWTGGRLSRVEVDSWWDTWMAAAVGQDEDKREAATNSN